MSARQSKTGSRSHRRTRAGGAGKSAGRRKESNTGRSASARRSASAARSSAAGRRGSPAGRRRPAGRSRRSEASASYAVKLLKQDHRAVADALKEFQSAGREQKQAIARRICKMLTVHSQIEEELLYPAAREALDSDESHLIAEAGVEHASVKDLVRQIEDREQLDEQYEAKVQVLGEYVKHHVAEEETELFPRLARTSLDLQALGERLEARKRELSGEDGAAAARRDEEEEGGMPAGRPRGGRGNRSTSLHARRR